MLHVYLVVALLPLSYFCVPLVWYFIPSCAVLIFTYLIYLRSYVVPVGLQCFYVLVVSVHCKVFLKKDIFDRLTDWLTNFDWLIDQSISSYNRLSINWSIDWLMDWLIWLMNWSTSMIPINDWSTSFNSSCVINQTISHDRSTGWLIVW